MAQFPPGLPRFSPPPPWFSSRPLPPAPPFRYNPPTRSNDSSRGRVIAGIFIGIVASVLLYIIVCSLCRSRSNRARAAAAAAAAGPQPLSESSSVRVDDEQPLRQGSPTAGLPAFTFSMSVKHNVTGAGEEAAMCSVCLGALQLGETVRLLPVCLHLYHAECIDPWLEAHSTCPICRSDTDPTTRHV